MIKEEYYFWFCTIGQIGLKKKYMLLELYQSPEEIYRAGEKELRKIGELNEDDIASLLNKENKEQARINYELLQKKEIYFISREKKQYPDKLKNIYHSPLGLFVKGKLPEQTRKTIAIIGARACSGYGREMAKYLSGELAKYGIQIISGLASGIDGCAHQGALRMEGNTYGILGCGIDICYPRENIELYVEMQKNGGVISEYGIGVPPLPQLFPMRNRIISGLSDGILVIEAREKSGSLITVDMGLEQGKDIYAMPGRATDVISTGCNNLIKMGAKMVTKPEDILEELHILVKDLKKNNNLLETKEKIVYASLSFNPKHLETIMDETKLDMKTVTESLLKLQLKYLVKQTGNYYSLIN